MSRGWAREVGWRAKEGFVRRDKAKVRILSAPCEQMQSQHGAIRRRRPSRLVPAFIWYFARDFLPKVLPPSPRGSHGPPEWQKAKFKLGAWPGAPSVEAGGQGLWPRFLGGRGLGVTGPAEPSGSCSQT